jgi:hypothetical protein
MTSAILKISNITIIIFLIITLSGCGGFRMTDAREVSPNPDERIKKNMEEGRGLRIANVGKQQGDFQFASSNPLWRASLDILDFAPLISANYSGGILITDWISTDNKNETFKITVKFLSNEIRPDGLDIIIHQKTCQDNTGCDISKLETNVINDLKIKILKRAALYEKEDVAKLREELGEYRVVPIK